MAIPEVAPREGKELRLPLSVPHLQSGHMRFNLEQLTFKVHTGCYFLTFSGKLIVNEAYE